ncbi:hypothetical protein NP233_g10471 [Leucocoprinus birnbaumii]|uniref:Uncharacterized protein n=1 Tax=Leucocoprinus birnbaumii TaxID=56174 RepID=A0AAD5VJ64_9AGAR|nr:hypothetical protein NP233_g10471 [Leucocoprinus birnbaumii]
MSEDPDVISSPLFPTTAFNPLAISSIYTANKLQTDPALPALKSSVQETTGNASKLSAGVTEAAYPRPVPPTVLSTSCTLGVLCTVNAPWFGMINNHVHANWPPVTADIHPSFRCILQGLEFELDDPATPLLPPTPPPTPTLPPFANFASCPSFRWLSHGARLLSL